MPQVSLTADSTGALPTWLLASAASCLVSDIRAEVLCSSWKPGPFWITLGAAEGGQGWVSCLPLGQQEIGLAPQFLQGGARLCLRTTAKGQRSEPQGYG